MKQNLQPDEQDELEQEQETLSHAEEIKSSLYKVTELLDGEEQGAIQILKEALSTVDSLERYFPKAKEISERIRSAYIDLNDLFELIGKKQTVNIYGQSNRIRITQNKVFELHRRIMLDRDAGVFLRRPRTNVDYLGSVRRRPGNKRKQKSAAGSFQKRPASVHYFLSTSKTWLPRAESAEISQTRPSPSLLSVMVRSG